MKRYLLMFCILLLCLTACQNDSGTFGSTSPEDKVSIPAGFSEHTESHNLKTFSKAYMDGHFLIIDADGRHIFRCLSNDVFTPENVQIDSERGLILRATVTGNGRPGNDVPREETHSGGVMSGKHYHDSFSFWSFSPKPPTNRVRVDIYTTLPRPLGSKLAVWSFADDWYSGGGSLISLEMDFIEAGGHPDEWVDGSRDGMFRYHPNLHCWFGGGSPWGHQRVMHMEPKNLNFGPEDAEHKISVEWINGSTREEKILRYLLDDQVVYERSIADLKDEYPQLDRGGMAGVTSSMSAKEIAEFMWNKPQNLQLWYGADRDFFLSGVPQYGDDWPSEMIVQRIDVFR